jgi:hypothetical protein
MLETSIRKCLPTTYKLIFQNRKLRVTIKVVTCEEQLKQIDIIE